MWECMHFAPCRGDLTSITTPVHGLDGAWEPARLGGLVVPGLMVTLASWRTWGAACDNWPLRILAGCLGLLLVQAQPLG